MSLSTNGIINLSTWYVKDFNLNEEKHLDNIKEILRQYGKKNFYIFWSKNFLILSKQGKFTIEVPSQAEWHFLKELQTACYIKVTKRRKKEDSLYSNEIYFTIDVYYWFCLVI